MIGKIKVRHIRWILLSLLLGGIVYVKHSPLAGERYAQDFYPYLSDFLSRFSSLFPFSVGDCLIYGSVITLLSYWVYVVVKRLSKKNALIRMVEYLLWIYVWFYWAWGLNYFRQDFYTRLNIPRVDYSAEVFRQFLTAYTDSLNASFISVEKIDKEFVSKEVKQEYTEIANRFLLPYPADFLHPKPMLIPSLMSGTGVLGYIGPFFIEYNLNPELLPVQYPFTYAQEMAHVLGISSEAEANLYGFLVCSRSSIPEIRFSAYLAIFPYVLSNAYNLLSKEDFVQWKETVSSEIKKLYNEKNLYWQALYNPLIGNLQQVAYNWYLKQNNIPSGQKNYSEVIGLLIALWFWE